jgi:hypothetical protein
MKHGVKATFAQQFAELFPRLEVFPPDSDDPILLDTIEGGTATYDVRVERGELRLFSRGDVADYVVIRLADDKVLNEKEITVFLDRHLKVKKT